MIKGTPSGADPLLPYNQYPPSAIAIRASARTQLLLSPGLTIQPLFGLCYH